MKMTIKKKFIKKEKDKKLFKLINDNKVKIFDKKYENNEYKLNLNLKLNNNKITKYHFPHSVNNNSNKIKVIYEVDNIKDMHLLLKSEQKEFTPRIIFKNNDFNTINDYSPKKFKKKFSKNNSFIESKKYLNISKIKLPLINKDKKDKDIINKFNKRYIIQKNCSYESCNDLSYKLYSYNGKSNKDIKEKNKSVFDSVRMSGKKKLYLLKNISYVNNFINKEMHYINEAVKKSLI